MSEDNSSDDPLSWVGDIDAESPEPLPKWARENNFNRSGRNCPRCHGELLERRRVAYTGMSDSYIMIRCENYEKGCTYQQEVSPGSEEGK